MLVSLLVAGLGGPAQAKSTGADACLGVAAAAVTADAWAQVGEQVEAVVVDRTALFPSPSIEASSHDALPGATAPSMDLDIHAGHDLTESAVAGGACLEPGFDWTARFRQSFLQAGADEMLAQAPTTPGIDSRVDIEWFADEDRLRTTLTFAGPLDIPNGTCWIDDVLSIDEASGTAQASGEQGVRTSPFAEGACGRFFDHLSDGGAGEQAITLFPVSIVLDDGGELQFVATALAVTDTEITVSGTLETR